MKIFISHDMSGLSDDEVKNIRSKAEEYLKERFGDNIEIIDNYTHPDAPENAGRLWHLGRSIQQLEEANAIYFVPGYSTSCGYLVESFIARWYNLNIIEDFPINKKGDKKNEIKKRSKRRKTY